jgi:hypothetical protein
MSERPYSSTPTDAEMVAWLAELSTWPPTLSKVAARFAPWAFFRLASTGAVCRVHDFHEYVDGSITLDVVVRRRWNPDMLEEDHRVIGIAPTDLESVERVQ